MDDRTRKELEKRGQLVPVVLVREQPGLAKRVSRLPVIRTVAAGILAVPTVLRFAVVAAILSTVTVVAMGQWMGQWRDVFSIAGGSSTPPPAAAYTCNYFAAPTGNDANTGTEASPWKTAAKLFNSTPAGSRGCLRAGHYQTITKTNPADPTTETREQITVSGGTSNTNRKILSNYPGEKASVCAGIRINATSGFITFEGDALGNFDLDGTCQVSNTSTTNAGRYNTQPSPFVIGDDVTFKRVNVHKRVEDVDKDYYTGVCFYLGTPTDNADRIIIEDSAIHHCGVTENSIQPRDDGTANPDNHGVYVDHTGTGTIVRNNLIYHNGERGLQLYDGPTGAVVHSNIFYENYQNININGAAFNNTVRNNIAASARLSGTSNIYYGNATTGSGNVVSDNCGWKPDGTHGIEGNDTGVTVSGSLAATANPIVNPATLQMAMASGSNCSTKYPGP